MPTAYPPTNRYSTPFELSNLKNSLKSGASAGIGIEGPSKELDRTQPFLYGPAEPIRDRVVGIMNRDDLELGSVQCGELVVHSLK
jgi:hypothetical protein